MTIRNDRHDTARQANAARTSRARGAIAATLMAVAAAVALPMPASAELGLQVGSMTCKGQGGWGLIIASERTFDCTFATIDGKLRGSYTGTIRRFGLDLGRTGDTALTWVVIGPAEMTGETFEAGSLAGEYRGVGASAAVAMGGGAHAMVGGAAEAFALQPVSVQVQTGLSVAAGIEAMSLVYNGPLN